MTSTQSDIRPEKTAISRPAGLGRLKENQVFLKIASVILLLIVWQSMAWLMSSSVMPAPLETVQALIRGMNTPVFWSDAQITIIRIIIGFLMSMIVGIIIGLMMGLSRTLEGLLDIWVAVGQTIPSLCWVIIAFIMMGLNEQATAVAVTLTASPIIAVNVWSGVKAIDPRLGAMARTLGASPGLRLTAITLPQVAAPVMASARFGFGIVWKVVVLAELLGRTDGIGYRLNYWFQLFRMEEVFALTLFFSIIMVGFEILVLKPIEKRLFRWRPETSL